MHSAAATTRASTLAQLLQRLAPYFEPAQGGHLIDQAWQPRLAEGMVRAYLVDDRVTGFGHQARERAVAGRARQGAPPPGPRLYHAADCAAVPGAEAAARIGWIELLRERVGLARERLPLLWDCDFMFGGEAPPAPGEPERYVLCEINVSSVSPFPPSSIAPLVAAVKARLAGLAG